MKATLTFDLPDEKDQFTLAIRGDDLYFVLQELDQKLRSKHKYQDQEWAWQARQFLHEMMDNYDVNLNMVS